jgi:hypothetical protein
VEDDAAILERTAAALASRGLSVRLGGIELAGTPDATAVLAMCQSAGALATLDRCTVPVINSPDAIRACHRSETVRRLAAAAAPFARTRMVATDRRDHAIDDIAPPCWVKRGDVHAMSADDVRFAERPADVRAALADLHRRGIASAALQSHVAGTVIKFYGVVDGRFFRAYSDTAEPPAPIPLLWETARVGATVLGLEIFGGDLIVTPQGDALLIDVNDWPSFARCRDEAAEAIAGYVHDRLRPNAERFAVAGEAVDRDRPAHIPHAGGSR